jgi:hypothetical protein
MKKTLVILILVFLAIPFVKTISQDEQTTGGVAQIQEKLMQEYFQQGKELSKLEEERYLKTFSPEMKAKLEEIKKIDKNKYYYLLKNRFPSGWGNFGPNNEIVEVSGLAYSNENMKKEKELEIDVELLALKLKNADKNSQEKIRNDLTGSLGMLFNIKEEAKQKEVEQLEKRLQELKQSLQYRKQNRNEIVQRRIQELLGDAKYLKWE